MTLKKVIRLFPLIASILIGNLFLYSQSMADKSFKFQNAEEIRVPLSYSKDAKGFWVRRPPKTIESIPDTVSVTLIGKNNKTRSIYGMTNTSIMQFFFSKENYSDFKKDKLLQNLKEKDWEKIYFIHAEELSNVFMRLNENRSKEIEDSIAEQLRIKRLRAEEEARREAIRRNSIIAARKAAEILREDEEYRASHPKNILDISGLRESLSYGKSQQVLGCVIEDCGKQITSDIISPVLLSNDTLVCLDIKDGPLGVNVITAHAIKISDEFRNDTEAGKYLRAWGDTLMNKEISASDCVDIYNSVSIDKLISEIKKKAPNGYIEDWSWDHEYGPVTFYVRYCNTNSKTIKYIKFFFTIFNDVKDVRGRGSVQGTGPLEEFESASWNFEHTGCWPSGDASKMRITKIVITYMNGSTVTLSGDKIQFE